MNRLYGTLYPSDFNPRSLTGATPHGPIYRRPGIFQSTLPYGSDLLLPVLLHRYEISIHAPLRERLYYITPTNRQSLFQSTLLYGSDASTAINSAVPSNFNPRSLTGATLAPCAPGILLGFQSTLPYGSDCTKLRTC